jgi:YtkA-like protein
LKIARYLVITLSLAMATLAVACHNSPPSSGALRLTLVVSPEHPRMTKPITLHVRLADAKGRPVSDAHVDGELTMKVMDMGVTKLTFTPKGNGDYEASVKSIDMSGPWKVDVTAKQGSAEKKQAFDVNVLD